MREMAKKGFSILLVYLFLIQNVVAPAAAKVLVGSIYRFDSEDGAFAPDSGDNTAPDAGDNTSMPDIIDPIPENPDDPDSLVEPDVPQPQPEPTLPVEPAPSEPVPAPLPAPETQKNWAVDSLVVPFVDHTHADHDDITFEPFPEGTTSFKASGNYYLTENVFLTKGLTFSGDIDVNICLDGHSLTAINPITEAPIKGDSFSGDAIIKISGGARVNIYDCYTPQNHLGTEFVHKIEDGRNTLDEFDIEILGGLIGGIDKKKGIVVDGKSELHMYGGTVARCTPTSNGAIFVKSGAATLESGVAVKYNKGTGNGGAVFVSTNSSLILNGADIDCNAATGNGGGVYLNTKATLEINEGSVSDNKAGGVGAGVYAVTTSNIILNDAEVRNNVAAGGVGGIYVSQSTTVKVSGDTRVCDNTTAAVSEANITASGADFTGPKANITLAYKASSTKNPVITVTDKLSHLASIGIASESEKDALTTAHSLAVGVADGDYNGGVMLNSDFEKLFSDDEERSLLLTEGKAEISTGRVHAICGYICNHLDEHGEPIHGQEIYNPSLETFTGGEPRPGFNSYYVEKDIELDEPVVIKDGRTVNICLNGHMISNKNGPVFVIEEGATLNICDCYGDRDNKTHGDSVHTYRNPVTKEEREVNGGLVVGDTFPFLTKQAGGIIVDGGAFELFSGTVAGACRSSGVDVRKGGSFTMWGGSVNDNYNVGNGGGVCVDDESTFVLRGGNIMYNRSTDNGGGVYAPNGFDISGELNVSGNTTNAFENNVFIPAGVFLNVTGNVTGRVGVRMERVQGVFTRGGIAAASVASFKADPTSAGSYVDVQGSELCLTGYGILYQPTTESRAVSMRSPENVTSYQWYKAEESSLTASDVKPSSDGMKYNASNGLWECIIPPLEEGAEMSELLECLELDLKKGDTICYKPQTNITGVALRQMMVNEDGVEVPQTVVYNVTPAEDGGFYVAAPEDGAYIVAAIQEADENGNLEWQVGSRVAAQLSIFRCGAAVAHQTGAGYTGPVGDMVICEVEYEHGKVIVYSEPFTAGDHSHLACGSASCNHNPAHAAVDFTPLTANIEGELLAGENVMADRRLTDGNYVVVGGIELGGSIIIDGDVTICLMGNNIVVDQDYAIKVNDGATLQLVDCAADYGRIRSNAGGGLYLADGARAVVYAADISGSRGAAEAGGVYVSPEARLEISSKVRINDNKLASVSRQAEGADSNAYLAGGVKLVLFEGTSSYTKIGVTTEKDNEPFTEGARGSAALERFSSDIPGKSIRVLNNELTFMFSMITSQPTASRPTVGLNNSQGATFQWYLAEGADVTRRTVTGDSGTYNDSTRMWTPDGDGLLFTVELQKGDILRLIPAEDTPEGTRFVLNTSSHDDPIDLMASDGAYQWTAVDDGETFVVHVTSSEPGVTPSVRGEIYQVTEAQEGKTTNTYSGEAGAYVCRVTYEDGIVLQSDLIVLESEVKPSTNHGGGDRAVWNPFEDIKKGAWYYYSVKAAYMAGLMSGVDDHTFAPEDYTTRAMMVTMLWRMAGSHRARSKTVFVDVDPNSYYYQAVCWADENQIVEGMDETHFAPDEFISREQIATLLYRYATVRDGLMIRKWAALDFSDLPADWAMEAMQWAVENQIIRGRGENLLDPRALATRAEIAAILSRYKLEVEEE